MKDNSPQYWLSLEQWRNDPEFQKVAENEFVSSPLKESDSADGWARREFLKLMGASLALGSFGCVRRPAQKIVPYAKAPIEIIPGIANYYTSSYVDSIEGFGTIVKTREGRPIKIEGNPDHPSNLGSLSARANAHVLSVWDPDRLNGPKKNLQNQKKSNRDTIEASWEKVDKEIPDLLKEGKVAVLTGRMSSPTARQALTDFCSAYKADWLLWEATGLESAALGQKQSFGRSSFAAPQLDKARYVVSIDCDFLGTYLAPTEFTKKFSAARSPSGDMTKLVSFESLVSLTGLNADERYRIKPSQQVSVVLGLLAELINTQKVSRFASDSKVSSALQKYSNAAAELNIPKAAFKKIAEDLWRNRGKSAVLAGGMVTQTENAAELQAAVNFLNAALENDTNSFDGRLSTAGRMTTSQDLEQLVKGIQSGRYQTVIIYKSNPVYSAPADLKVTEALRKAKTVIYIEDRMDETGQISDYVLAVNHPVEAWSDAEIQAGVYSIQQPTLRPLYNSRSFEDNMIQWSKKSEHVPARMKDVADAYEYLRNYWKTDIFPKAKTGDFETAWDQLLQTGVVNTKTSTTNSSHAPDLTPAFKEIKKQSGYELALFMTVGLADGTLANVSWLQEFPDPVTKICWDNYVCFSPSDAKKEKLKEGDMIKLTVGEQTVTAPIHIQPGQSDGVLGLAVGYGRTGFGKIANNVGVNAYPLSSFKNGLTVYSGLNAKFEKTGEKYELAATQDHHSMEGREIVIEATLAQYKKNPSANIHREKIRSIWSEHQYPEYKWGMVIDLNTCTGCSACVIACQSENNIPTIGKKYVLKGREMHWIRIDRYYTGTPEEPQAVFQPMTCQHCDNAPCETVCPVLATVHSDEGTNDMIYNRCVGTRYCSNNCPYKVRRFNWFNYVKTVEKPLHNALNPEVTVRSRGVMEKCTFCTHRIQEVKQAAKLQDRKVHDGEVKTACQQTCPANAITFGNLKDPESAVAKLFHSERNYAVLGELNTQPALHYLSKIRNAETGHEGHHS